MKSFVCTILLAFFLSTAFSQDSEKRQDLFYLDVLNFYSPEGTKSRVDIYVEIPMGKLVFKKSKKDKGAYVSKFDMTIDVKDNFGSMVYNNVSKEEVKTYEAGQEYLSQNSHILTRNIFLAPGEYSLRVSVEERSTQIYSERVRKFNVEDYASKQLSISDVMVVSRMTQATGKKVITPDVARNVVNIDTFYLFYYVYSSGEEQMVGVNCRILDAEKKEVFSRNEIIDNSANNLFQNQLFMGFPTSGLSYGKFTIEITAAGSSQSVSEKASFNNQSMDLPLPLSDIDELVNQLQYIAKDEEMAHMKEARTTEEKQKRFLEFWKKKDPNPDTRRNEVMQEYYRRLLTANKNFTTTYNPGWRTDMGMVFIIFGQPSNIDRHPFDQDAKPYEVWQYYDINKEFVFVDNFGFGDYRLVTPIWETFRYVR